MTPWGLTKGYFLGIVVTIIIASVVVLIVALVSIVDATIIIKKARLATEKAREDRLSAEATERMELKKYAAVSPVETEEAKSDTPLA